MHSFEGLPVFLKDFLIYIEVIQGKSKATSAEYLRDLRTFFRYLKCKNNLSSFDEFENITIDDVTIDMLRKIDLSFLYEYMYYVSTERKNSANARARKVSSLKSFFKYLTSKANILTDNPAKNLDAPKIPAQLPKYLTLDESRRLLSGVNGEFEIRNYCILTLFLNCGLRVSELTGINISSITDDKFTVIGKGNKERTIYLNSACKAAIDAYLRVRPHEGVIDRDALFLSKRRTRISVKMVQVVVKNALENAGLDTKLYSAHKLRHTAATLLYKHGHVDVRALQEILGHKHLSTTQIYTHVSNDQLKDAIHSNPLADETIDNL